MMNLRRNGLWKGSEKLKETLNIDVVECPYCGYIENGGTACNYDMSCQTIECEKCGKEFSVSISCEFLCTTIDD